MVDYSKIFGQEWYLKLKPFLESSEFKKIGKELKHLADDGELIIPEFSKVFKAFKCCPYNTLSVIFLSSNSYDLEREGLAFCGENTDKKILKEYWWIESALLESGFKDRELPWHLKCPLQGVLLLNTDLTSIKGKPGTHNKLWNPFISYVMKTLAAYNTGLFFVLVGKEARKQIININPKANDLLYIEHPMTAIKEKRRWDYKDCFGHINRVGDFLNNKKINW